MAIICWQRGHTDNHEAKKSLGHVTVVVVGGTGDLARKYLWQGFFQLYADQVGKGHTFSFYGGGLSPTENGTPLLFGILKELACPPELSAERCTLVKDQFLHLSKYHQLKTTEDYEKLSQQIKQQLGQEGMVEAGGSSTCLFQLSHMQTLQRRSTTPAAPHLTHGSGWYWRSHLVTTFTVLRPLTKNCQITERKGDVQNWPLFREAGTMLFH